MAQNLMLSIIMPPPLSYKQGEAMQCPGNAELLDNMNKLPSAGSLHSWRWAKEWGKLCR